MNGTVIHVVHSFQEQRADMSDLDNLLNARAAAISSLSHVLTSAIETDFPQVHLAAKNVLESVTRIPLPPRRGASRFGAPRKGQINAAPTTETPFRIEELQQNIEQLQTQIKATPAPNTCVFSCKRDTDICLAKAKTKLRKTECLVLYGACLANCFVKINKVGIG